MKKKQNTKGVLTPDADFFAKVPTEPGVYIMKDVEGVVIYVGKAKNVRSRLKQYFIGGGDERAFISSGLLRRCLGDIETIVASNEKEALLLENNLIKKHKPKFNIKLRDDKEYLVLKVDTQKEYPRIEVVRKIKNDDASYYGPYHSATSCRQTLRLVNRHFQLRTCTDHVLKNRTRPCLQYQIKRCPGPCVFPVDKREYNEHVDDVMLFLAGKNESLLDRLHERMENHAESERFEIAASVRDAISAVQKSLTKQNVIQSDFVDIDVFGMFRDVDLVFVSILFIRSGKWVGSRPYKLIHQEFPDKEVLEQMVQQYYSSGTYIPERVLLPFDIEHQDPMVKWLSELKGKQVSLQNPKRGSKLRLIELAKKNAAKSAVMKKNTEDGQDLLMRLQKRLRLKKMPIRMECFDIAHTQGNQTVASMVTFIHGKADKKLYRKFIVKNATNDDFASMHEVLTRRFKRALKGGDNAWNLPDLLVVDGGKGQLNSALGALKDCGIESRALDIVSLAKERELKDGLFPDRVYLSGLKDPLFLRANSTELLLLSRLRDEAHRFANTFHGKKRTKSMLHSTLDDITGVGPARKKNLLKHFGSVKNIRLATAEELAKVPSITEKLAKQIATFYALGLEKRSDK